MPYALHLVLAEQNDGAAFGRSDVAERLMPYALCLMPYALCLIAAHLVLAERNDGVAFGRGDFVERLLQHDLVARQLFRHLAA